MRPSIERLFHVLALTIGLGLMQDVRVSSQTFVVLHSFAATIGSTLTNSEGANPQAALFLANDTLYGTASASGNLGHGTVFAVSRKGIGFSDLHSFAGEPTDGAQPTASVILATDTLYGTAGGGEGSGHYGTIFAVKTNGMGFTNLHHFTPLSTIVPYTNIDGAYPYAALVLSGNTLYGTTIYGGGSGNGTVFAISLDGTGFRTLHSFTGRDGANPFDGLILSGNTLYGTTWQGGSVNGTVFKVNTDGRGFATIHSFTALDNYGYNSEGAFPSGGLILSGNTLFGTAAYGGDSGNGTLFKVNTDGSGFKTLHHFSPLSDYPYTNSDGANPFVGLILSGNTLFGTAASGGDSGNGTVFNVNTDGLNFTTLHSFTTLSGGTNSDGSNPSAGLILSGTTLYGAAKQGGSSGKGTLFSLFIPPKLGIIPSVANVVLVWPTNATGFNLQSTTNLGSPAVWTTNSSDPFVVNGQNTVTNPISGTQQFFRLSQ